MFRVAHSGIAVAVMAHSALDTYILRALIQYNVAHLDHKKKIYYLHMYKVHEVSLTYHPNFGTTYMYDIPQPDCTQLDTA